MSRFIKLETPQGTTHIVNTESISVIQPCGKMETNIFLVGVEPPLWVRHPISVVLTKVLGTDASCGKCAHFLDDDGSEGMCTRNPPDSNGVFPMLSSGFRCGEFKSKLTD